MPSIESIVGIAAGVLTSASLLPQLIKTFREKKSADISLIYLITLFCGLACWIWYGLLKEDYPIIITNSFSLIVNSILIVLSRIYKGNK
ncbi:SemiSWEET family sugar transporter [Terrimonas ferruginea]|uniref:SemiSWEET family sugar transporter n=1 Tax=Terrimonas ferruginea TaxID=249 RepID=UPI0003F84391|nr:SemiSWEET transporter [Terrimonas ferruginea]